MSFCGCEHGRHNVSNASCVNRVGTAPAHERAGITRDKCGALPAMRIKLELTIKLETRMRNTKTFYMEITRGCILDLIVMDIFACINDLLIDYLTISLVHSK